MAHNIIPIYMTSFFRKDFTEKSVKLIHERTTPGTFQIHIYDNGSDKETRDFLYSLLEKGLIVSLQLDSRNTGCVYNKVVFQAMTEYSQKYYCVTDNDILPPKLSPDWLSQMVSIMEAHPRLAFLTPQLPPQCLQEPDMGRVMDDIVYCKAVGNTLKLVRRNSFPDLKPILGAFGDDAVVCKQVSTMGYDVAFCRNIFCYHAGQCDNWGYKKEEVDKDPRKSGYGKPFIYSMTNEETYEPFPDRRI